VNILAKLVDSFVKGVVLWILGFLGLIYLYWIQGTFEDRPSIILVGLVGVLVYRLAILCVKVKMDEVWRKLRAGRQGGIPLGKLWAWMPLEEAVGVCTIADLVWTTIATAVWVLPLVWSSFGSSTRIQVLPYFLLSWKGYQMTLSYGLYVGSKESILSNVRQWFRVNRILWVLGLSAAVYHRMVTGGFGPPHPTLLTWRLLMLLLVKGFMPQLSQP